MEDQANDAPVLMHIQSSLPRSIIYSQVSLDPAESARLAAIQVELDQCWDLLRQRRALRETGGNADAAQTRPPEVVEKYVG